MTTTNYFGQELTVGDVVSWGHRDGNMTTQQIGIILKLTEKEFYGRQVTNATCRWVLSDSWKTNYTSTTGADGLFLLDVRSLSEENRNLVRAELRKVRKQLREAEAKEQK